MTLTPSPTTDAVPDALLATLPPANARSSAPPADRLGASCDRCAAGIYGLGPGAGHVCCHTCGHATLRRRS